MLNDILNGKRPISTDFALTLEAELNKRRNINKHANSIQFTSSAKQKREHKTLGEPQKTTLTYYSYIMAKLKSVYFAAIVATNHPNGWVNALAVANGEHL